MITGVIQVRILAIFVLALMNLFVIKKNRKQQQRIHFQTYDPNKQKNFNLKQNDRNKKYGKNKVQDQYSQRVLQNSETINMHNDKNIDKQLFQELNPLKIYFLNSKNTYQQLNNQNKDDKFSQIKQSQKQQTIINNSSNIKSNLINNQPLQNPFQRTIYQVTGPKIINDLPCPMEVQQCQNFIDENKQQSQRQKQVPRQKNSFSKSEPDLQVSSNEDQEHNLHQIDKQTVQIKCKKNKVCQKCQCDCLSSNKMQNHSKKTFKRVLQDIMISAFQEMIEKQEIENKCKKRKKKGSL